MAEKNRRIVFTAFTASIFLLAVTVVTYQNCAKQGFVALDQHSDDGELIATPPPVADLPPPPAELPASRVATTAGLTVAFIGDQNMHPNVPKVLQLIKAEGADLVVHAGDLAYDDLTPANTPTLWDQMITKELGANFPYLVSVGNHDTGSWEQGRNGGDGYKTVLLNRVSRVAGLTCTGEFGIKSSCTYKGLFLVLSGVGVRGTDHAKYLDDSLRANNSFWKVCVWHKNQHDMQIGSKPDEVGWQVYEVCRQHGAIVATAHQHIYARTHLLSSFENKTVVSTSSSLKLALGRSFAFVSGISGSMDIRGGTSSDPWWAKAYTADNGAQPGALFCRFNLGGKPNEGRCQFKNIANQTIDDFNVAVPE